MLIPKFESMVELNDKSDGLTKHLGKKKGVCKIKNEPFEWIQMYSNVNGLVRRIFPKRFEIIRLTFSFKIFKEPIGNNGDGL